MSAYTPPPDAAPPRRILPFSTPRVLNALYQLGPELGHGQFGVIRLCTCHASGTLFACKSISKLRMQDLPDILREVRIMQRLSVPFPHEEAALHSVRLHQVIEDDFHVHLIMELCCGGELYERIVKKKCYAEAEAASIIKRLMQSIQSCHRMGIMHRDVKPENILFVNKSDSSPIKLADFGLALEFSPGKKFSGIAGSAYYIAPEVLEGEYSEEVDVWSAGVVLYVMLSGVPPFWGKTDEDIFNAIREASLEFTGTSWNSVSFSAKDLIRRMLCADVKMRLTPAQVLEHPWILHHSKAFEEGSVQKCHETPKSNRILTCKLHSTKKVAPVEPASASTARLSDMDSSFPDSLAVNDQFPMAGTFPESKHQVFMIKTNRRKVVPVSFTQKDINMPDKDESSATLVPAESADVQERSSVLQSGKKSEQIFGLESGKRSCYLLSHQNGREKGQRIFRQCHKSVAPLLNLARSAQALAS
ncbi:hypothetical protein L7F22_008394 [Adiantum nelumboides]|nr:hypothetical protein [Adiantum nelumboides]